MKIYFGFTVAGDRSGIEAARRGVQVLEKLGHEVLTRHLVEDDAWEADRRISAQDVYRRDMAWLQQCELFIAEVSGSSFGLGFEAGYVLGATNKRVILLYRRQFEQRISLLIRGNSHANCTIVPYTNVREVEEVIAGILQELAQSAGAGRPAASFIGQSGAGRGEAAGASPYIGQLPKK